MCKKAHVKVPLTHKELARLYVKGYSIASTPEEKEKILRLLADEDLAVLEELLKTIADQCRWIKDAKEILKRG